MISSKPEKLFFGRMSKQDETPCRSRSIIEIQVTYKVIYTKYTRHGLSTVAHTIDCVCSKILNHGLNNRLFPIWLFLSLFKVLGENTF